MNNEHCFKEDLEYGQMLIRMWSGDLSKEDCQKINTRVIGYKGLKLPATSEGKQSVINHFIPIWNKMLRVFLYLTFLCCFVGDTYYVCPTNKRRNYIQVVILRQHIQTTHPGVNSNESLLPEHTLIIEAHITSSVSKKSQQRIDRHLRNCIITSCGDADVMMGTKHIDQALCIYIGAYLICIDNKHLRDKVPRGNGTLCRVVSVKLRKNASSYIWKYYYGKKVWTVNAKDVEWVQCEHVHKPGHISQLELQINDLEKVTDKHQNHAKLLDLKERLTK